ncbi:MAG: DsbA family protein, partial [Candidatus Woesearchaeota archaeon]
YRHLPLDFHPNAMNAALAAECARDQNKFWQYHDKLFENQKALDLASLKRYAKDLGLDTAEFDRCLDNRNHLQRIQNDIAFANSQGISGTPTFLINNVPLVGAMPLSAFEAHFEAFENPVEFTIYLVTDKRCLSCPNEQLRQVTLQLFPTATFVQVDVNDAQGKALVKELGLTVAPMLIFDKKVTQTAGWKSNERIQPLFELKGNYYVLSAEATGSTWIIDDEARAKAMQQVYDLLGMDPNDNIPQIDFFVMSYCPFGNQAEELLKPVYDKLKGKAKFNPRYVIYNSGQGCLTDEKGNKYCSLHGGVELNQNLRELCVYELYGEGAWFDFAIKMNTACNDKNADTCWTPVAQSLGYDVDAITACFEKNKLEYVKKDFTLNQLLGVQGSPTIFIDGVEYQGPRSAQGYMIALCNAFKQKPSECDEVAGLESIPVTAPQGSC